MRLLSIVFVGVLSFAATVSANQPGTLSRADSPIRLKSRTFVPPKGVENEIGEYFRRNRQEKVHVLMQFYEPSAGLNRDRLSRDKVQMLDPIPERAFFVSMPRDAALANRLVDEGTFIKWIGVIRPDDKIAPSLKKGIPEHARRERSSVELVVQFFGDVPARLQERILQTAGARLLTRVIPINAWRIVISESSIPRIARLDEVKWIEEIPPPPEDDNDGVRSAAGLNAVAVHPPELFNLTGAGVVVAQWESSHASTGHGDYSARITIADPPVPPSDRNDVHNESVTVNGAYDIAEGVYRDGDDSATVSANDVRLTAVGAFAAGSTAVAGDADVVAAAALVGFAPLERYADTVTANFAYTPGEGIYFDADGAVGAFCGTVTAGDTRRTAVGAFAAGSVVAAGNADIGQMICRFNFNAHYHATHVAGTVLGDGSQSVAGGGTAGQWKGVAPGASLRSYSGYPMSATGAPVPADEYTNAAAAGAAISTNSWGSSHCHQIVPPSTCYDTGSQYYDAVISGKRSDGTASGIARQLLIFGSAGNRGYPERHNESVTVNGQYDNTEGIYSDFDDSGTVSVGDQRRTAVGAFAANSVVQAGHADLGTALVNFTLNEAHDDTVSMNTGGNQTYDTGEGVYLDTDSSRTVTVGDTRVTPVGAFAAGTIVAAGNVDVARNLRRFKLWMNVRVPNSAKNTVEVANVTSDAAGLDPSSSRGPTDDGRIKPDLAAPGCQNGGDGGTTSTFPGNLYASICGTSMSTPAAAGAAALIEEWYRTACVGTGASPATLKAMLLHSAADLTAIPNVGAAFAGPDFAFGFGRARVNEASQLIPYHRQGSAAVLGNTDYTITVGTVGALKVTLTWDDPPFTANAAPSPATGILQNDLDLLLIAPDGTQYTPWEVGSANPFAVASRTVTLAAMPIPAAARDRRNPVEQVIVDNAINGTWTIRVTASTLNLGPQSYTLVSEALPVNATPCSATPAADVWLMDTPADTGAVPSTGSQWLGPDPWNRLAADGLTTHENPEFGQPNYLYATLRNATAATVRSTSVDFWVANSSIGLVWPDNFVLVGRLTVPNMGPSEVRQVGPLVWSPPNPVPNPHHCMLVRVQSPQDPITFAEGPWIVTNSMNSNNIVYRNLDIVNLMSSKTVSVLVRNVEKETADVDLTFEIPDEYLRNGGEVLVGLSPALEKAWPDQNRRGAGIAPPDPRLRVVKARKEEERPEEQIQAPPFRITSSKVTLRGFRLGPRQAELIRITFRSNQKTKATYDINVIGQIRGTTIGGYQFVVRTGNK